MRAFIERASESLGQMFDPDRVLVVGNAQKKRSVYLYGLSGCQPSVVARLAGNHVIEKQCGAEHEIFRTFSDLRVPDVIVPRALGEMDHQGITCYFQEVVTSNQWQNRIPLRGKHPKKREFELATRYLVKIHKATRREDDDGRTRCFQHGDYWIGNLGQRGSSLVMYDLEYGKSGGDPLYDLFHFSVYYRVAMRNRGLVGGEMATGTYDRSDEKRSFLVRKEDIETVFINEGPYRNLVAACIKRYCDACMISSETAAGLLKHFVEHQLENNHGIQGFPSGWEQAVTGNR